MCVCFIRTALQQLRKQAELFPTSEGGESFTTTMQRALPAVGQSRKYLIWLFTLSPSVVL